MELVNIPESVDFEIEQDLINSTVKFRHHLRRSIKHLIHAGEVVLKIKNYCENHRICYSEKLKELKIPEKEAQGLLRVLNFSKTRNISKLRIAKSVLLLLIEKNCGDDVLKEIECLCENGEKVTLKIAQAVIEKNVLTNTMSDSYEYHCQDWLIAMVKLVLTIINIDVASCVSANARIGAEYFFSKDFSGLDKKWDYFYPNGPPPNVFMNVRDTDLNLWCPKLLSEVNNNRISQAIAIINACTSSLYFQNLVDSGHFTFCFVRGKLGFHKFNTKTETYEGTSVSPHHHCLLYYGPRSFFFREVFFGMGFFYPSK